MRSMGRHWLGIRIPDCDLNINGSDTLFLAKDKEWVHVELVDYWELGHKLAELNKHLDQFLNGTPGLTAHTL